MATTWGGWHGAMRVGIDIVAPSVSASTTSVTVTVYYYVQTSERFADDQTLNLTGGFSGPVGYRATGTNGQTTTIHVATRSFSVGTSYSGGPSYTFGAYVSGAYNGAAPSHSRGYTVPARPPSPPGAPAAAKFSNVTSSSVRVTSSVPATNGASILEYRFRRSLNSNYSSGVVDTSHNGHIRDLTGLSRATRYYVAVQARNSAGWGPWSTTSANFTTAATAPDAPAKPTVGSILPDSAVVAYAAPNNGGSSITGYDVQIATNSGFTTGAQTFTSGALSGLAPSTTYYVRVRAKNAVGAGTWSATATFDTLAGAKVKVGGVWVDAKVFVKVGGAWKTAKVWRRGPDGWEL